MPGLPPKPPLDQGRSSRFILCLARERSCTASARIPDPLDSPVRLSSCATHRFPLHSSSSSPLTAAPDHITTECHDGQRLASTQAPAPAPAPRRKQLRPSLAPQLRRADVVVDRLVVAPPSRRCPASAITTAAATAPPTTAPPPASPAPPAPTTLIPSAASNPRRPSGLTLHPTQRPSFCRLCKPAARRRPRCFHSH